MTKSIEVNYEFSEQIHLAQYSYRRSYGLLSSELPDWLKMWQPMQVVLVDKLKNYFQYVFDSECGIPGGNLGWLEKALRQDLPLTFT